MRLWRLYGLGTVLLSLAGCGADVLPVYDFEGYQDGVYGDPPQQSFKTESFAAPVLNYGTWRKDLVSLAEDGSSHIFLTLGYEQSGPYVFSDEDLSLVYADPSFEYTMNARVQTIDRTDYLTFWHGARNRVNSMGYCVFYNSHYELTYNVTLGPPFDGNADMHECEVTPDGNVLVTAYPEKRIDLTPIGGHLIGFLTDGCFQEVEPRSGHVVFSWCASEWFEVALTYWDLGGPSKRDDSATSKGFDVYHINSVQKTEEGNYLVSLRNLKLLAYIDCKTGKPIWRLGGKVNDFIDVTPPSVLDANANSEGALSFGWQHHVRFIDEGLTQITLLDNHKLTNAIDCAGSDCSRGRHLQIDTTNPGNLTVQLIRDYRSTHHLTSVIYGSMQALQPYGRRRGSFLVGWGVSPEFSEHTMDGELIRDVQYSRLDPQKSAAGSRSLASYRVFKHSWRGYPMWPPEVVIDKDGSLFVSWNGATEVRSWAVYGSHRSDALGPEPGTWNMDARSLGGMTALLMVPRRGFETKIEGGGSMSAFVKVVALDAQGEILGTSRTMETGITHEASSCLQQNFMSFTCLIRLLV